MAVASHRDSVDPILQTSLFLSHPHEHGIMACQPQKLSLGQIVIIQGFVVRPVAAAPFTTTRPW